jgi:group I intron endonuclease
MVGIYCIYSKLDNNVYIGSSITIEKRLKSHWYLLKNNKHSNRRLQKYVNDHGIDSLDSCVFYTNKNWSIYELRKAEEFEIQNQKAYLSFNLSKKALVSICSEEGRKRISESAKLRQSSKEYKDKLALIYRGTKSICSKLKKEDIDYIRNNAIKSKSRYTNIRELALKFSVNRKTIFRLLHNITYKND